MKRYLLFAGDYYYPYGGWIDFVASFDTIDEAMQHPKIQKCDWYQVVDSETGKIVKE